MTTPKNQTIASIMSKISKCYQSNSGVYQNVEKALQKLSRIELQGLCVMIGTSIES